MKSFLLFKFGIWAHLGALFFVYAMSASVSQGEGPLAPGRFGQAWNASTQGFFAAANPRLGKPPLTVELWVKGSDSASEHVLVCHGVTGSGEHWELLTEERTGNLLFVASDAIPYQVKTGVNILNGEWRYVAAIWEVNRIRLYVDGKPAGDVSLRTRGLPRQNTEFSVGARISDRRGSPLLIDDVRISEGERDIVTIPQAPFTADRATIALNSFEESEEEYLSKWTPGGETHQRGLPYAHRVAEYEHSGEDDWIDGRWQDTDKGPFVCHTTLLPGYEMGAKLTTVFPSGALDKAFVFDQVACGYTAIVENAKFMIDPARFGMMKKPSLLGDVISFVPAGKVWRKRDAGDSTLLGLQPSELRRVALNDDGDAIAMEYTVQGRNVRDVLVALPGSKASWMLRTIHMTGTTNDQADSLTLTLSDGLSNLEALAPGVLLARHNGKALLWAMLGNAEDEERLQANDGEVRLSTVNTPDEKTLRVAMYVGPEGLMPGLEAVRELRTALAGQIESLNTTHRVKKKRWPPLKTIGKVADKETGEPYVVDDVTIPFENPFKALFYISAIDFFPDGKAAVCTVHGDVWIVTGLDAGLQSVEWHRFATGLYQPLGINVYEDFVYVLGRDQITRLVDKNGDLEADRYECFNGDLSTQGQDHAYAMRLERDLEGNLYFLKSSEGPPHGSSLIKLNAKTNQLEVFAKGFRHTYGMGIGPNGQLTVADNEGNWVPASKIDWIEQGGFYGYLEGGDNPEKLQPRPPLCYLPKPADNSCGGQNWYMGDRWGPYHQGEMLHLSWGRCTLHSVLRQNVKGVWQAATVRFPHLKFHSGSGDAQFSPTDGQLYVVGLNGWQTAAERDGCFQRVRYTGQPVFMPDRFRAQTEGIHLRFTQPLNAASALEISNYRVEAWNYRWSPIYGSYHYKPSQPDEIGHDEWQVESVAITDDGHGVFLKIPAIKVVNQVQIQTDILSREGKRLTFEIDATLNALANSSESSSRLERLRKDQLIAWCIVPFDKSQRGPQERAQMLVDLGMKHVAYDWRDEHISSWDEELNAYQEHGITLDAFWAPITTRRPLTDEPHWQRILELLERHHVKTQLWVMLSDSLLDGVPEDQKTTHAVGILAPVVLKAAQAGCQIELYNHGGWFGDGENQIRVVEALHAQGLKNVGVVYNFHHGHEHIEDFKSRMRRLLPYLAAVNLNGMDKGGPKILAIGLGKHEKEMLQTLVELGYEGPYGILNHQHDVDAKQGLQANLTGLEAVLATLKTE